MTVLSLAVMAADAASAEGAGRTYPAQVSGLTQDEILEWARRDAASAVEVVARGGAAPPALQWSAAWLVGVNAGLCRARGISPSNPFLGAQAQRLDQESLRYMAMGRCQRLQQAGATGDAAAQAAWIDGFITGCTFDTHQADLTR